MRLTDEPGQDIENFGIKMVKISCRISRTGSTLIELSTLLDTDFINCEVLAFNLKAKGLNNVVDSNPKALSVDDIIWTLKTKLQSLKAQGMWGTDKIKKLDTEVEMAGLKMTINDLVESQKMGRTGGNG